MRENGTIKGGYITTKDSLKIVHQIRTKLDLMIIGGNTVRTDRPILDARFALKNKAPDILIYSSCSKFDHNIPLFNVNNRKTTISNNLNLINNKKFIMCEGGYGLLKQLKRKCDYLVIFISHKIKFKDKIDIEKFGFKKIYSYFINNDDEIIFLRKI
jgi:diaminohydroxyphosphoribosylaminopyrimidine deaminase/5-amino-6-(5-phosphoribosylamino)uracil reductase